MRHNLVGDGAGNVLRARARRRRGRVGPAVAPAGRGREIRAADRRKGDARAPGVGTAGDRGAGTGVEARKDHGGHEDLEIGAGSTYVGKKKGRKHWNSHQDRCVDDSIASFLETIFCHFQ